ncbi:MAG TPA: AAA family ATPase [Euzebyales bacterium]
MSVASVPVAENHEPWDAGDARIVAAPPEDLRIWNLAGILGPVEVHGARTLSHLVDDDRPEVLLAAALALRAPQHGHVCVEFGTVATTTMIAEDAVVDPDDLAWPEPDAWRNVLADSPLVRVRPEGTPSREELEPEQDRPLVLVGDRLYLDRYWRYERRVAAVLAARAQRVVDADPARVREVLERLTPPSDERPDRQRLAVATALRRHLTVIAGGPGTGKTHTVARLLAAVHELADGDWPQVALAAPTGKAADRLTAALRDAAADPQLAVSSEVRGRLRTVEGSTLHRLLGWRPGSATRFRHDRSHRLPHELVIVDETSMVDLPLMSKLVEALRPDARLVLVGDPDQLASVEAGAVLADIIGPVGDELRMSDEHRRALTAMTGEPLGDASAGGLPPAGASVDAVEDDVVDDVAGGVPGGASDGPTAPPAARRCGDGVSVRPARPGGIDDSVVVLGTVRRFAAGSGIARLAGAIHAGDGDEVLDVLRLEAPDVTWIEATGEATDRRDLTDVRERVVDVGRNVIAAARAGDAARALDALDRVRILTAHRHGAVGVDRWVPLVERWLTRGVDQYDPAGRFPVGRPVMVTRNDPHLRLFNGDVGVVVRSGDAVAVGFRGGDGVRRFAPSRLEDIEIVHAMTIHKSQGSQFGHVVIVLPEATSQILTRELLYTAVTRAQRGVTVIGTADAVRAAVDRRVARASGLRGTLWRDVG